MSNPQVTLQIVLTAEAFATTAVQQALAVLLGAPTASKTSTRAEAAEPATAPKAKRRTKAEIEAARAAEANDNDNDDDNDDDDSDANSADDNEFDDDNDDNDDPAVDLKALRELFNAKAKANRDVNAPKLKALLKKYSAAALSDLDEDDYEAVFAAASKLK